MEMVDGNGNTHVGPLHNLLSASRDMTWPHTNFIGGFSSELVCRKIGQANIEWYRYSASKSISICEERGRENVNKMDFQMMKNLYSLAIHPVRSICQVLVSIAWLASNSVMLAVLCIQCSWQHWVVSLSLFPVYCTRLSKMYLPPVNTKKEIH